LVSVEPVSKTDTGMRMRKAVRGVMRGRHTTVLELLRPRRRRGRGPERAGTPEPLVEGVIYLTPDGDGYILYTAS